MKKKIAWLILSCLIVTALALTSCGAPAEEGEKETIKGEVVEKEGPTVEEEEGPEMVTDSLGKLVEKPQYGGEAAFVLQFAADDVDPFVSAPFSVGSWLVVQPLTMTDWLKGHRGTGELDFRHMSMATHEGLTGALVESWEQTDLYTATLNVRQGVRWQDIPPANGRELTADDIIYSIKQTEAYPRNIMYVPLEEDRVQIRALDKYTIEIKWPEPDVISILDNLLQWINISNMEAIEAYGGVPDAFGDWRMLVGTGPYILTDVVAGSSATFQKNPNYWQNDPFHPDNRLPYIDTLYGLEISDVATRLAAVRTGKIADFVGVDSDQKDSLVETNPELL